jgi:hypothetical protein
MVSDPTLITAEDVRLTQLLASRTFITSTVRRFSLINYWHQQSLLSDSMGQARDGVGMYHHCRQVRVGLRYCDTYSA